MFCEQCQKVGNFTGALWSLEKRGRDYLSWSLRILRGSWRCQRCEVCTARISLNYTILSLCIFYNLTFRILKISIINGASIAIANSNKMQTFRNLRKFNARVCQMLRHKVEREQKRVYPRIAELLNNFSINTEYKIHSSCNSRFFMFTFNRNFTL